MSEEIPPTERVTTARLYRRIGERLLRLLREADLEIQNLSLNYTAGKVTVTGKALRLRAAQQALDILQAQPEVEEIQSGLLGSVVVWTFQDPDLDTSEEAENPGAWQNFNRP